MPSLLSEFQKFDEDRTGFFRSFMEGYMGTLNTYPPLLTKMCDSLNDVVGRVDKQADVNAFVEANRTAGVTPPPDIGYDPYDSETGGGGGASLTTTSPSVAKAGPSKPTVPSHSPGSSHSSSSADKTWGLTAADEKLSTAEKQAKLEGQLKEITEDIASEIKSKKGLDKLVKFYASDPGAQKKAIQEADDQQKKVDTLKEEKAKITKQLESLGGVAPSNANSGEDGAGEEAEFKEIKAKGLFDYEAANDTELSFKAGDILTVTEQDESGWWYAELNGKQGFVPNNYVSEIKD